MAQSVLEIVTDRLEVLYLRHGQEALKRHFGGERRRRLWLSTGPTDFRLAAEQVWASGHTIVVSTDIAARPLDCFRYRDGLAGPIVRIPARLPPQDVAITPTMVYAADALGVVGYRLPWRYRP